MNDYYERSLIQEEMKQIRAEIEKRFKLVYPRLRGGYFIYEVAPGIYDSIRVIIYSNYPTTEPVFRITRASPFLFVRKEMKDGLKHLSDLGNYEISYLKKERGKIFEWLFENLLECKNQPTWSEHQVIIGEPLHQYLFSHAVGKAHDEGARKKRRAREKFEAFLKNRQAVPPRLAAGTA